MFKLLKKIHARDVLCVGCGSGEECAEIAKLGFKNVIGTDLSPQLIELAQEAYPKLKFQVMNMEKLRFPKASFDVVYSSLAIHYARDWTKTLRESLRVLRPGGMMLFSTQHPTYFGSEQLLNGSKKRRLLGYDWDKKTDSLRTYGDVLTSRKLVVKTEQSGVTFKMENYFKSFSDMVNEIVSSGFEIVHCNEPKPVPEAFKKKPSWSKANAGFPLFLIFELRKPK